MADPQKYYPQPQPGISVYTNKIPTGTTPNSQAFQSPSDLMIQWPNRSGGNRTVTAKKPTLIQALFG